MSVWSCLFTKTEDLSTFQAFFISDTCVAIEKIYICIEIGTNKRNYLLTLKFYYYEQSTIN
jgi:hypothetical protein